MVDQFVKKGGNITSIETVPRKHQHDFGPDRVVKPSKAAALAAAGPTADSDSPTTSPSTNRRRMEPPSVLKS